MLVVLEEETSKTRRRRVIAIMTTRIRMDINLPPNNNQGGEIGVASMDALIEIECVL
jgi:hypothetical protein